MIIKDFGRVENEVLEFFDVMKMTKMISLTSQDLTKSRKKKLRIRI